MDLPNFKGGLKGVFTSYSSLLVPIGIVLVGVLLFIPTQLMSARLQKQIATQSVARGQEVSRLTPVVPSREQWRQEEKYQQKLQKDASQADLLAEQTARRELLSYEIFPDPKHDSVFIFGNFGRAFRLAVEKLTVRANSGVCPTKAELDKAGQGWSRGESGQIDAAIKDGLCRQKAEAAAVYASPVDLDLYNFWGRYKYATRDEAIKDCWYSQLAYWIIEDLFDTIAACNSGSQSVFTSPVKRLLKVSFTSGAGQQTSPTSAGNKASTAKGDKPRYVLSADDALAASCTKRITNDNFDVVHFKLSVVVSTGSIPSFMQELCSAKQHNFSGWDNKGREEVFKHNQITILDYKISAVDRATDVTHELYRYGEHAVVELELTCEYIFNKDGYDEVKPEVVKQDIKGTATQTLKARTSRSPGRTSAPLPGTEDDSAEFEKIGRRGR